MKGSVAVKLGRLAADLMLHPYNLPRYIPQSVFTRKTPLEFELPRFSYGAIDFLDKHLHPRMSVAEYGSGGSTIFFARRVRQVYSIEDDPEVFQRVSAHLKKCELTNATLILCPFQFRDPVRFEKSAYLHALPERQWDVIVIDGSGQWSYVRPICFRKAEGFIRNGGMIVVDDSWRYPELRTTHHARFFRTFQSVGPCRPGVTSTDIYFY